MSLSFTADAKTRAKNSKICQIVRRRPNLNNSSGGFRVLGNDLLINPLTTVGTGWRVGAGIYPKTGLFNEGPILTEEQCALILNTGSKHFFVIKY